ncbi:MAG TPA: hypothetical protein PKO20_03285 [Clostridiales bacterium]|jgi:hypothetical protein|nr:hypothetical protein [Clostridiales bacterium]HPU68032.1 hypothetical protein [Clostridiales bacterium]HQA06081.1 hypothetical protein [Clostridiales bacterium]HQD72123.1 hypothetical protein [Clostridiales bacterium]HXK83580.1 hypothetical protein [Clostridiales bacterium]
MRLKKFFVLSVALFMCFVFPIASLAAEGDKEPALDDFTGGLSGIGDFFGGIGDFDLSKIKDIVPGADKISDFFGGIGGGLFDGIGGLLPGFGSKPTTTETEPVLDTTEPTIPELPTLPQSPTMPSTSSSYGRTTTKPTTTEDYEPVTETTTEANAEESSSQNTYTRPSTTVNYTDNVDSIRFDSGDTMSTPFKIGLGAGMLAVSIGGIVLIVLKFKN